VIEVLTVQASSPRRALSHWLAAAAADRPNTVALETPDVILNYAELDRSVGALAEKIRAAGLVPGDRLGIAATRSADTIIAILAAVAARVAYVPLDLAYPPERLQAMMADAAPRVVVGAPAALAELRQVVGELPSFERPAPQSSAVFAAEAGLTYVLFTSGSTGRPKGVAMGEAPLAHLIDFHAAHPRLGQPARTLQFAPLSFDVHFQEIFSSVASGGTLVMVPEHVRRDPMLLHRALREQKIERIFLPYVALQMIADASREQVPEHLREVVSAGEQLQVTPAIRSLFRRLPQTELHNHYGPTESHVVTAHELRGDAAGWPDIPPIGIALPHVELALRDPETGAITTGEQGELLLGGDTLANGYLGRPELTIERFKDDLTPLRGRWYVTGDLVRRDAAGVYTYLGRADQQLKVDGFRIEPGEIEVVLMAHPAVKEAVVTAPELSGIGKQLIAHLVLNDAAADTAQLAATLRSHLRKTLPEYMIPVRYLTLAKLPTTPSGKIDRRSLPLPATEAPAVAFTDPVAAIRASWLELLGLTEIGDTQNLFDLGARSLLVLRFVARMKEAGFAIGVADVYDRPTIAGIASGLTGGEAMQARRRARRHTGRDVVSGGVAIVGMATRSAGAADVEAFWNNLLGGKEGIRHFSPEELDPAIPASTRERPNFVAVRGALEEADKFDAAFFGISAREATLLDPQQRLMLELSWTALEHAAIDPERSDARIGVYAGTANNTYITHLRQEQPELVTQLGEFAAMLASEKDYVATRVSNRLNLKGPAVSVHTACSTGLVAVTQAWHALAADQCDVALAGGATIIVPQEGGYLYVEDGMESADGHCRPFDAAATGTVFASAGAVVVLKRLEDAEEDGDTIYAVIRGVGLNNDGAEKASFTAPSVSGQAAAIRMALDHAGFDARSIGYVEAHGTGTALGDPIEIAALTRAWRVDTADSQYCGIGSVKSNLGHTIAAAGVLGLIKSTLALHREMIPATLHFRKPNPQIDFTATPFNVIASNTPWPRGEKPRRAAISSFGVGGTNAHLVIEEAPATARAEAAREDRLQILPLSAKTAEAAIRRAQQLGDYLKDHPEVALADVVATLTRGRQAMNQRVAVVAADRDEAVNALRAVKTATAATAKPRVVFLFPGQGSQHPGMARHLYDTAPAFREALDRCLAVSDTLLDADLRGWLTTADAKDAGVAASLAETRYAQPALFSVSYALAAWLESLGVQPDAMIGHSIGELAAACHAGVMSVEDAMRSVIARGAAMFEQPRGSMLAVRTDAPTLSPLLPVGVEIAAANAPQLTVVAGPGDALDAFAALLESRDIGTTKLRVSHAFHSASMEPALPLVVSALQRATLKAPSKRLYSCVSGAPLRAEEATDPQYWARQVRATVQFSRALQAEIAAGDAVFIEVGPSQALTALLRQHRTAKGQIPRIVSLLGPAQDPGDPALKALQGIGAIWCAGVDIAWPVPALAARAVLPTYPFARERHWFKRRTAAPVPAIEGRALSSDHAPTQSVSVPSVLPVEVVAPMSRLPVIEQELRQVLSNVSGVPAAEMNSDATFLEQGLDSLSLTQAVLELERVFGVRLRFRRLLEELDTLAKLSGFLDQQMPAEKFAQAPAPVATPAAPVAAAPLAAPAVQYAAAPMALPPAFALQAGDSLLGRQLQLIEEQLRLVRAMAALPGAQAVMPMMPPTTPTTVASPPPVQAPAVAPAPMTVAPPVATVGSAEASQPSIKALVEKPFGASARITLDAKQQFTSAQRQWLDDFIARYNGRSGKSKTFSQTYRKDMGDPRVVTGFNPLWKDLVYPIVVNRSKGARLWDIDGNEYIDLLSAFGANLLGYQPDFVLKAMHEQLDAGIEVGPQHPLAADVARLIAELTGMDRVAFCNTGSEAVMGAMRIARTVTGRKTIAIFTNSYHGIFDEVIVRGTKQLRSLSAAPGILANAVENVLVLDYDSPDSLRILRERGRELAAIMIEPIQNKYPTLQPREFVRSLREIADAAECALIFDEVVTGFRVAPGGAQEFYGVRADIATYGKVIGGGLPFAAIAGRTRWIDALDGGHWQYGDDSYPEAGVTYFAGTFVRHPLALAAAKASLEHLKRSGRELYKSLGQRTQSLADRLNAAFRERGAPVKAVHCASLWRLSWDEDQKHISLFYYLARYHGLHLYEQFGHFVTEAFGDAEIDRIVEVFVGALDELMALGFITPKPGTEPPSGKRTKPEPETASKPEATLAPGQTERWLAASFDTNARTALNESFCVSLGGGVDLDALRMAMRDVIGRHEAFRIKFDADQPRQRLVANVVPEIAEVDLRGKPDAAAALDEFCSNASLTRFELDKPPLAAFSLLQLSDGRKVAHVVASHLIFDGWASSVFNAELAEAYKARSSGRTPVLDAPESPLVFAEQEQARFEGADGQESLEFWAKTLKDPPKPLALGDRAPGQPRTFAADTERISIEGEAFAKLRTQARQSGATLFQMLLTAVTIVLQRRSAQEDFVISIPYAAQQLSRRGPLMGDGVLDLPLRLGCTAQEEPKQVLARVRTRLMDALEYPVMTQGTVARALGIRSAGDRPPLTGVYFNLNPRVDLSAFAPLAASMHEGRKRGTLSELFFNFYEKSDALSLDLHYSTEFFSPARAQELVAALQRVCISLAASLTQVPSLEAKLDERLLKWNATDVPLEQGARVEQWVTRQAQTTPEAIALEAQGVALTYRELDERANRFGNLMRERGVGAGDLVGLCLSRGPDLVPALLGVLKTGAAYVPLDPGFPRDRLHYMAEDAAVKLVITQTQHADLAGVPRAQQLQIDADAAVIAAASAAPLPAGQWPDDAPIYVIYTSGSTGKPKGVALPQNAVCNFLASMRREPGLTASDRLLAVTTLSFDIAVLELLLPLVTGARVILAQREDAMDGEVLGKLIEQHGVTVMQATPTTWHMLLDAGWVAPSGLRGLCGGEPLPPSLAARLLEAGIDLWNMYGPTETTVWSTLAHITDATQKITIGHPIDNTQVWVLDENRQPVPVGAEGEICIGGDGVAIGYFKRPELTAEKFVRDPFRKVSGARIYRTGDLGRWREDGTIEHLGRLDFQVKIRGYRIELGEIEARLDQLPEVARSVVVAREDTPGDIRLVGYFVAKPGLTTDTAQMREVLRKQLPDYMLPQFLVALEAMPLLPNGKINRKALPVPTGPAPTSTRATQAPRNETERAVATAMQSVLKIPAVGADDDFFSLGGHSLLAARLIGQLNRALGLQLALRTLFESPTVAKLAAAIDAQRGAPTVRRAPIVHRAEQATAPLTMMQERIRFIEEMFPGRVTYNAPSAHRLKGRLDLHAFDRAFVQMMERQPALRSTIVAGDNGFVQQVHEVSNFTLLPLEDLSGLSEKQREATLHQRIEELVAQPFELDKFPLFKHRLFKLANDEHALFFMPHHIIWDGWSFDILYTEISALYEACLAGKEPTLPAPPVTYGDFAVWHNEWLKSDEIRRQIDFWKAQYEKSPLPKDPPTDMPRQRAATGRGATAWMHIETARAEQIRDLAKQTGSTMSIVALSVYAALMAEWLDDPRPAIGMPVRGRPSDELEGVMGFFNNLVPTRISVNDTLNCLDWIKAVRQSVVEVFANQDVPFELLAQELSLGRKGAPARLYQVMFSFQDARARQTQWGPLHHERIPAFQKGATEDINLWMVEIPSGIEGGIQYNSDLFHARTAEGLRDRFLDMLNRLVANPQQSVAQLLRDSRARTTPVQAADSGRAQASGQLALVQSAGASKRLQKKCSAQSGADCSVPTRCASRIISSSSAAARSWRCR
jgi:amino acid adenylation domain-containing protein